MREGSHYILLQYIDFSYTWKNKTIGRQRLYISKDEIKFIHLVILCSVHPMRKSLDILVLWVSFLLSDNNTPVILKKKTFNCGGLCIVSEVQPVIIMAGRMVESRQMWWRSS